MKINIEVATVATEFEVDQNATVKDLIQAFLDKYAIPEKALSFRFAGKLLDQPEKPLSYYRIREGCKIFAQPKPVPGLTCLGPFEVVPNLDVKYRMDTLPYVELYHPASLVRQLSTVTREVQQIFQVSPAAPVTLPDDIRREAHIPLGPNVFFRWVYPFVKTRYSTAEIVGNLDKSDPLIALALYGGYMYVDDNDQVIQVNGIKPGPGLFFDGPYKISQACFDFIQREGRFQECTVELEGCTEFCWFLPNEHINLNDHLNDDQYAFYDAQDNMVTIEHGAFGYNTTDGMEHRLFRIVAEAPTGHFPTTNFDDRPTDGLPASSSSTDTSLEPSITINRQQSDRRDDMTQEEQTADQQCTVCLQIYNDPPDDEEFKRVICKPCNHSCMHYKCANQLLSYGNKCPICRATVTTLEKFPFLS